MAVGSLSRGVVKRVGAVCRRTATWSQDFDTIHLLAVGPRFAVEPVSVPLCVPSGRLVPGQAGGPSRMGHWPYGVLAALSILSKCLWRG